MKMYRRKKNYYQNKLARKLFANVFKDAGEILEKLNRKQEIKE